MLVLQTPRLALRWLELEDAPFILDLLNDPGWLQHIGDKGVRTLEQARAYIADGPVAMIARHGHGLYLVETLAAPGEVAVPIGLCGLIRRPSLGDPDLGYAFLPAWRRQGYAHEAAAAMLLHGREALGFARIVAIVSPGNLESIALLERLGMVCERALELEAGSGDLVLLYGTVPGGS